MRFLRSLLLPAALAVALAVPAPSLQAAQDFSVAERALFLTNHLAQTRPPADLVYHYTKAGTMEAGFEDTVVLHLRPRPDKACCAAEADFLTGPRRVALPEVEAAEGNPVLLFFLERDIREMNRLTKGQAAYFRKRIRMAVYEGAQVTETTVTYAGKAVPARQIVVLPYTDDPLRPRFEKLAGKRYTFTLSDAVPGGVVAVATRVDSDTAAQPLWTEQMVLEGATLTP